MEVDPKIKMVAPRYAAAKETFIRLDSEVDKLINATDSSVVSQQEMCIKNILQALLVQIPAVSHDIRKLAINGRCRIDNTERQDALKLALANIERLRKAQEQPIVAQSATIAEKKPEPKKATKPKAKAVRKKATVKKDK